MNGVQYIVRTHVGAYLFSNAHRYSYKIFMVIHSIEGTDILAKTCLNRKLIRREAHISNNFDQTVDSM